MQVNQPRAAHLVVVKTFTQSTESFFGKGAPEEFVAIGKRKRERKGGGGVS